MTEYKPSVVKKGAPTVMAGAPFGIFDGQSPAKRGGK